MGEGLERPDPTGLDQQQKVDVALGQRAVLGEAAGDEHPADKRQCTEDRGGLFGARPLLLRTARAVLPTGDVAASARSVAIRTGGLDPPLLLKPCQRSQHDFALTRSHQTLQLRHGQWVLEDVEVEHRPEERVTHTAPVSSMRHVPHIVACISLEGIRGTPGGLSRRACRRCRSAS